jgi:hypothetical protein
MVAGRAQLQVCCLVTETVHRRNWRLVRIQRLHRGPRSAITCGEDDQLLHLGWRRSRPLASSAKWSPDWSSVMSPIKPQALSMGKQNRRTDYYARPEPCVGWIGLSCT